MIRFSDPNNNFTDANYDFSNPALYEGNVFNEDPDFMDPENNKLIIGENSGAIEIGNPAYVNGVSVFDILMEPRPTIPNPDAGAFQHAEF